MTGEVVNLRQFRKRKARAEREQAAEANRQKFGRTRDERVRQEAEKALQQRHLDGHERDS